MMNISGNEIGFDLFSNLFSFFEKYFIEVSFSTQSPASIDFQSVRFGRTITAVVSFTSGCERIMPNRANSA